MYNIRHINPVLRATGIIAVVAALVTGITFAALTSNNVTLANSNFTTATAELKIWNPATPAYENSATGFSFTNIVPGTETVAFTYWLKNTGGVNLTVSSLGTATYSGNLDPTKVHFNFENLTESNTVSYTLAQLTDGVADPVSSNPLDAGVENQFSVKVLVDVDAITSGSSADMSDLDLVFSGVQPL